ncbi:uncharacterized protein LOC117109073 [Anneissia japonica]|uniref:uncharacterized protein LOC117109073 n=1 Tax=Anneissia japonica TaxID=1529436 RepID=UPI001425B58F|nr:uncharacterized protein LOC117109073 [Anneissia japonica]
MQEQEVLLEESRSIKTGINLWKPKISELILELVAAGGGNEDEVEKVRAWLKDPDAIPTKAYTIAMSTVTLVDFVISDDNKSTCKMCFGKFKEHIPFLPIIKMLIIREVDESEKERIAGRYIRELLKDATYKDNLEEVYNKWEKARIDTIQKLREIADEMDKDRKGTNIAKVVGSSVSVVGAAFVIGATVAAALIPGGLLLEGAIVAGGSAFGVAGGATNIGASFAANKLMKRAEAKSEAYLKSQAKTTDDLINLLDEYKKETKIHLETAKMFDDVLMHFKQLHKDRVEVTIVIGDSVEEVFGYAKSFVKVTKLVREKKKSLEKYASGGKELIRGIGATMRTKAAVSMVDDALAYSAQIIKNGTRVVGVVAGAAVIAIDIYSIVKTSIEMHKGSLDKAAKNIREAANELESRALPELKDLIIQVRLEAAEESGIPKITAENETK